VPFFSDPNFNQKTLKVYDRDMARTTNPIQQRRDQIESGISKLQSAKYQKKRIDFKSDSAFENWLNSYAEKLDELYEERTILDFPESYNEIPLAILASELGVGLSDIQSIVAEGMVEVSYVGYSPVAARVTRDEVSRAIDVGRDELMRRTRMEIPEIFEEALEALTVRDIAAAQRAYRRIEGHDSCINPFALAIEIGIHFLEGKVADVQENIEFILSRNYDGLIPSLAAVRSMFTALPKGSHLLQTIRERVIAIADGAKESPFRDSFYSYIGTRFSSQMSENQNLSIYAGDVVLDSIRRYKLLKSLQSSRSYLSEAKEQEIERVIHNAIYTALESHRTYNESPSSKMYVDMFVGVKSTRRKPPELIELLPKCGTKSAGAN